MPDNIESNDDVTEKQPDLPQQNPIEPQSSSGSSRLGAESNQGELLPRPVPSPEKPSGVSFEAYQGLLPHPDHLERFERLAPGAAERFMQWVETEANHRREMERQESEQEFRLRREHLDKQSEIDLETLRTGFSQTKVESASQTRVAMTAHLVAFSLVIAGVVLCLQGKQDGGIAAFVAFGAIYTSGTIAGIFRRDPEKSITKAPDSTAIEKAGE